MNDRLAGLCLLPVSRRKGTQTLACEHVAFACAERGPPANCWQDAAQGKLKELSDLDSSTLAGDLFLPSAHLASPSASYDQYQYGLQTVPQSKSSAGRGGGRIQGAFSGQKESPSAPIHALCSFNMFLRGGAVPICSSPAAAGRLSASAFSEPPTPTCSNRDSLTDVVPTRRWLPT